MQTALEVKNLKPFFDTHSWMLLTHSCIVLSTLFNVFPLTHKAKSSTNREQDNFNNIVNLNAEEGQRQDATLRDPHLLLVQLRQNGTCSNTEVAFRQEALDKPGEMASETEIIEVRQNAVLPRCVVILWYFLKVKENG